MNRSAFTSVAGAVWWRNVHNYFSNPSLILPGLLFPLFFFTAFAGGLSRIEGAPGFDYPTGYTAFEYGFVLFQASIFGGDLRRLLGGTRLRVRLLAAAAAGRAPPHGHHRRLLLMAAMTRAAFTVAVVTVVALIAGMNIDGGPLDLVGLYSLAMLVNMGASLFAIGVAMRFRTMQAAPVMQTPAFLLLFLAPVWVPFDLLEGWVHAVAAFNPTTAFYEAARGFVAGEPTKVALAFGLARLGGSPVLAVGGARAARRRARRVGGLARGSILGAWPTRCIEVVEGEGYAVGNVDALAEGPGFRKVRRALGVTAFGVNAIELPPGYETGRHFHEQQEELYFVQRGRIEMTFGEGPGHVLGPGGAARVDAATVRKVKNVGDEPAMYLVVGGKDGYVGRDGRLPEGEPAASAAAAELPADRAPGRSAALALVLRRGRCTRPRRDGRSRGPSAARCFRRPATGTSASTGCRCTRARRRSSARIGLGANVHADFGSGLYEGGPIGIPYTTVVEAAAARAGELRVRRRVRPRAATRSRRRAPIEGGRGSDGDRHVIVVDRDRCRLLRAVRRLSRERRAALARGLGRGLEPALEPDAPARLDVGRRRRPADPARPRPLRRGQARADRPRAALHGAAHAQRAFIYPARHFASDLTDPEPARDGPARATQARLRRLAASRARRGSCCAALKRYGMIVADNGVALVRLGRSQPRLGQRRTCTRCTASRAAPSRWSTRRGCRRPSR